MPPYCSACATGGAKCPYHASQAGPDALGEPCALCDVSLTGSCESHTTRIAAATLANDFVPMVDGAKRAIAKGGILTFSALVLDIITATDDKSPAPKFGDIFKREYVAKEIEKILPTQTSKSLGAQVGNFVAKREKGGEK